MKKYKSRIDYVMSREVEFELDEKVNPFDRAREISVEPVDPKCLSAKEINIHFLEGLELT